MISRAPIDSKRIRHISGSFSWIDHRLLSDGFLSDMTAGEILLYFFLVLVGDKNGVSFYSYDRICHFLKMDVERFVKARNLLIDRALIACEKGRFQVLQLPEKPKLLVKRCQQSARVGHIASLSEIFKQLGDTNN